MKGEALEAEKSAALRPFNTKRAWSEEQSVKYSKQFLVSTVTDIQGSSVRQTRI